ncbi:MAG: F0F1 ATP synthase subunit alpha [Alphaproteobacteria bacterium]
MLKTATKHAGEIIKEVTDKTDLTLKISEVSEIYSISAGTAEVLGLADVRMNELLTFNHGVMGMVQTLHEDRVGVVFLTNPDKLKAGDKAKRTHRVLDVPVGDALLGRVINPLGQPLDEKGPIITQKTRPIEVEAAPIMHRAPVDTPLQTGIKAIDSFTPIGRGQRELILGDRQTGKTAIAVDTIINQKDTNVLCIYCAIGQRNASVARVIADLKKYDVMDKTVVVTASGEDEAGMQYIAPYAATAIGEYFMENGQDVLIVYDDLTAHARAYRQMSLLLRTPPGREAFPGDIFYIHSRLLERATHLRSQFGGGSLTALPIVSTEAGNISAYIPTNIISITDGQIYLSTALFQKGNLPAIDTGRSVSRVGGDAQLPAYRSLVGPLKLFYSQFEELESFAKFGTQMDKETSKQLKRGRSIRSVLQQMQYKLMPAAVQIAVFMATNEGLLDDVSEDKIISAQEVIQKSLYQHFSALVDKIVKKREKITPADQEKMLAVFKTALEREGLISHS